MIDAAAEPDPPEIAWVLPGFSGKLAFDVGANVGQSAEILAQRFERVISLEPCQESFVVLQGTRPRNVTALQLAVTSRAGFVELTEQDRHLARGQLTSFKGEAVDGHAWGRVLGHRRVKAVTIDGLAKKYGKPDMIKCDVEGHEVEVFLGAGRTLLGRPDLYVEVHEASLGEALWRMLQPLYGGTLSTILHPHYRPDEWGYRNHYWLVARRPEP